MLTFSFNSRIDSSEIVVTIDRDGYPDDNGDWEDASTWEVVSVEGQTLPANEEKVYHKEINFEVDAFLQEYDYDELYGQGQFNRYFGEMIKRSRKYFWENQK